MRTRGQGERVSSVSPQRPVSPSPALPIYLFRAIGRMLLFDGFLRVWQEAEEKGDDEDEPQKLPELAADELLDLLQLIPRQHFTQPPPRYTEASLVKALEERGIGRPSTYASIMATLKEREYVVLEKRQLRPTSFGEVTCDALIAAFPDMMDYGFTAQVEDWLDDVSRGENDWVKALQDFYTPFSRALQEAEGKMRAVPPPAPQAREAIESDGATEGDAQEDVGASPSQRTRGKGRYTGRTKGRSAGRGARRTAGRGGKRTADGEAQTASARTPPALRTDVQCPKCGAPMVERTGPHGPFLGCSRYPQCKGTRNLENASAASPAAP
jgi:DNA topoisomerase-1